MIESAPEVEVLMFTGPVGLTVRYRAIILVPLNRRSAERTSALSWSSGCFRLRAKSNVSSRNRVTNGHSAKDYAKLK